MMFSRFLHSMQGARFFTENFREKNHVTLAGIC